MHHLCTMANPPKQYDYSTRALFELFEASRYTIHFPYKFYGEIEHMMIREPSEGFCVQCWKKCACLRFCNNEIENIKFRQPSDGFCVLCWKLRRLSSFLWYWDQRHQIPVPERYHLRSRDARLWTGWWSRLQPIHKVLRPQLGAVWKKWPHSVRLHFHWNFITINELLKFLET